MSAKLFLVNYENPELRIAEMLDGKLHDLHIERSQRELGSIFWGRIENIAPGIDAAFVNIGSARNGLLHFHDIHWLPSSNRITDPKSLISSSDIKVGQHLLVQIARPAIGAKGPKLTTRISLPGRYIVLVFPSDSIGVSQKIDSQAERNRLKSLVGKIRPLDCGIIVRTEAEGASMADLERDLSTLLSQMEILKTTLPPQGEPVCVHQDLRILGKIIRDRLSDEISEVFIDNVSQFYACQSLVRDFAPNFIGRIRLYEEQKPIFQAFNIEKEFRRALQPIVSLPHGGSLIIEETEALTVIDVNTARFTGKERLVETVLKTNLEAVEEATLQMRLRNLGGIILIDFINMERTRDRVLVLNSLESALKKDRVKTHIVQLSPSGLVEITRRREGLSLNQLMFAPCSHCGGSGRVKLPETVAIEIRQRLRSIIKSINQTFVITTHPTVAIALLGDHLQNIEELEQNLSTRFLIRVDETLHEESFQIEPGQMALHDDQVVNQVVNQRFTLGPHDRLYPRQNPEFATWNSQLVRLPSAVPASDNPPYLNEVVVLEISVSGRWFASARIAKNSSGDI